MQRSSIDVIADVLGAQPFPRGWRARSLNEIDAADHTYRAPDISKAQYLAIQERLQEHWAAAIHAAEAPPGFLFVCPRMLTRMHQYLELLDIDPLERLARSEASWRITVGPQLHLDDALIARKALLYSDGVVLRDPAEILGGGWSAEGWGERWQSAFYHLGVVARLVGAGCVRLHHVGNALQELHSHRSSRQARLEHEQTEELRTLYRAPQWQMILQRLPFDDPEEAGVYAGWALGQFACRNVVLPGATPWLPTKECLAAVAGLGEVFSEHLLGPQSLTLARLSSKVGVDIARISDEDIIAMRSSEELFSTWRRFVAELCLEVDRLAIDNAADVTTLVRARELLWQAELDRQIGRGGVLSGLFDAGSIACGVITGGVAAATGLSPVLTAASALGGGLATPLIRLFGNLVGAGGAGARTRAVSAHFMALEG